MLQNLVVLLLGLVFVVWLYWAGTAIPGDQPLVKEIVVMVSSALIGAIAAYLLLQVQRATSTKRAVSWAFSFVLLAILATAMVLGSVWNFLLLPEMSPRDRVAHLMAIASSFTSAAIVMYLPTDPLVGGISRGPRVATEEGDGSA